MWLCESQRRKEKKRRHIYQCSPPALPPESHHLHSRTPVVRESLQTTVLGLKGCRQTVAKATLKRGCQDILHVSNPETKYAIIISAVSNISSVTVQ